MENFLEKVVSLEGFENLNRIRIIKIIEKLLKNYFYKRYEV